jgi:ribosomal protein L37AE/L43A
MKQFRCENCRKGAEILQMRHSDGKWVCRECIPRSDFAAYPGLSKYLSSRLEKPLRKQVR